MSDSPVDLDRVANDLLDADEGDVVSFNFVWDGIMYTEEAVITEAKERESTIRPDDAPVPIDYRLRTEDGSEYIFVVVALDGELIPGFGAPDTFERKPSPDERATQLTDAELTQFEVVQ